MPWGGMTAKGTTSTEACLQDTKRFVKIFYQPVGCICIDLIEMLSFLAVINLGSSFGSGG